MVNTQLETQRVRKTPVGYVWENNVDENVSITFEFTKVQAEDTALHSILKITVHHPVLGDIVPYRGAFNLMAGRSRKDLAKYIASKSELLANYPWEKIVERVCQDIIAAVYDMDETLERLEFAEARLEYLLYPVLPKQHPTLIYAPGGAGKSLLALYIAMLVQNGYTFEMRRVQPVEVLYLDWEVDRIEANRRAKMLSVNFEDPSSLKLPYYRRCSLPLKDELEPVLRSIAKNAIGLVIIDSAAPALGGDINDASRVIDFFSCVRQITSAGATVLIISHVSKASKQDDNERTPIGSVYFENFPRLTFELVYESADGGLNVGLLVRKCNFKRPKDIGFKVVFQDDAVYISPGACEITSPIETKMDLIATLVQKYGPCNAKLLADRSGLSKQEVWEALSALKRKRKVDKDSDGNWIWIDELSDVPF